MKILEMCPSNFLGALPYGKKSASVLSCEKKKKKKKKKQRKMRGGPFFARSGSAQHARALLQVSVAARQAG